MTVLVDGQERTLRCAPNCRVSTLITVTVPERRLIRRNTTTAIQETLGTMNQVTEGAQVTLTTAGSTGAERPTVVAVRAVISYDDWIAPLDVMKSM